MFVGKQGGTALGLAVLLKYFPWKGFALTSERTARLLARFGLDETGEPAAPTPLRANFAMLVGDALLAAANIARSLHGDGKRVARRPASHSVATRRFPDEVARSGNEELIPPTGAVWFDERTQSHPATRRVGLAVPEAVSSDELSTPPARV